MGDPTTTASDETDAAPETIDQADPAEAAEADASAE
jgi:hypothetical protein